MNIHHKEIIIIIIIHRPSDRDAHRAAPIDAETACPYQNAIFIKHHENKPLTANIAASSAKQIRFPHDNSIDEFARMFFNVPKAKPNQ